MKLRISHIITLIIACVCCFGGTRTYAQSRADKVIDIGRNAIYYEDYVLAIQYFNQVIDAQPYYAKPYVWRGLAKFYLDDFAGAEADETAALERNPFLADAWEIRAVVKQNSGRSVEAAADYAKALELKPHNKLMLFNRALALEEAELYAEADSAYTEIMRYYPGYDAAYVGRAQLLLNRGDTVAAERDVTRAIEINPNLASAYVMRARLNMEGSNADPAQALFDIDQAMRLQPTRTYLRGIRGVLRYQMDDVDGALEDFDYILATDPRNVGVLTNRAILYTKLERNAEALADFNRLVELCPGDVRLRFNRAVLLHDMKRNREALADVDRVLAQYPTLYAGLALRGQIYSAMGNQSAATADFRKAQRQSLRRANDVSTMDDDATAARTDSAQATVERFNQLLALDPTEIEDADEQTAQFSNPGIRGRVQNRAINIEPLPLFALSYTVSSQRADEGLLRNALYWQDVEQINASHQLPATLYLTNNIPALTDEYEIGQRFESIKTITARITDSSSPRSIDYFARALDEVATCQYDDAIADLNASLAMSANFAPAMLMRAVARYRRQQALQGTEVSAKSEAAVMAMRQESQMALTQILTDLEAVEQLSPHSGVGSYNRGTILLMLGDVDGAIEALTHAVNVDPTMGAAWFNRGFARFSIGDRQGAVADLSRAGELGIYAAYSLLKRMNN